MDVARYTFKVIGLFDRSHENVEYIMPEQVKSVKITSVGDYHNCEQYAMMKAAELIKYFDADFKKAEKDIKLKLIEVDYSGIVENPDAYK